MHITWYNGEHRERSCNITSISDIQKHEDDEGFCLLIRKETVFLGGKLGKFKSVEERDKAYDDIKDALDAGEEEYIFRPGFYSI